MQKKKRLVRIVISEKLVKFNIFLLILIILSFFAYSAFNSTVVWHPIQRIATNDSGTKSIDENQNGIIDNADNCNVNAVCNVKQIKMTDGAQKDYALTSDSEGIATWKQIKMVSGTIIYYNGSTCPDGWSKVDVAVGRYIVGLNPSGILEGIAGTALTNLENRVVPLHTHTNSLLNSHVHSAVDPPNQIFVTGSPSGFISTGPAKVGSLYAKPALTGVQVANEGYLTGTNAPYVQLLVCIKN